MNILRYSLKMSENGYSRILQIVGYSKRKIVNSEIITFYFECDGFSLVRILSGLIIKIPLNDGENTRAAFHFHSTKVHFLLFY